MHALSAALVATLGFTVTANALQCNSSYPWYSWASNGNGQDPCQLVSDLRSSCGSNAGSLQPLSYDPSGTNFYPGPNSSAQSTCTCSYVMYNLMAACGDCQVGFSAPTAWPTYQVWAESCGAANASGIYPDSIPDSLRDSIPVWARFSESDSGDPRWSYGLSHAVAAGRVLVNSNAVPSVNLSCPPSASTALPIGTAFAGLLVGLLIALIIFVFQRKRSARVIPPPTRYHTAPDNTPLHPLVARPAYAQGTNFLRRMLENEHENDPRRIEPFDISAAAGAGAGGGSFPPHPAVFPPRRVVAFPPALSISPSRGPSRQASQASLNPNHPSPLRHSRSLSQSKSSSRSRPQTAASQFSSTGSAIPGPSMLPLQNLSPSEPPSPLPPDRTWPDVPEDPPAYRRKS